MNKKTLSIMITEEKTFRDFTTFAAVGSDGCIYATFSSSVDANWFVNSNLSRPCGAHVIRLDDGQRVAR